MSAYQSSAKAGRFEGLLRDAEWSAREHQMTIKFGLSTLSRGMSIATAKILATIDVLSGGRLILGVGAGWMREEFALLGAPFAERGTVTDEYLEAFKALWTQQRPTYTGRHVNFAEVIFEPKPIQKPHPPIWVGGESPAALRRAVKLGDAWYPGNNSQTEPLDTPARLATAIASLRRLAQTAGCDPASLAVNLIVQNPFEW